MSIPKLLRIGTDLKALLKSPRFTPIIFASLILGLITLAGLAIPERVSTDPGTPTPIDLAVMQVVNKVGLGEPPSLEALVLEVERVIQVVLIEKVALVDLPGVDVEAESELKGHTVGVDGDGNIRASLREGRFQGTIDGRGFKAIAHGVELTMPPSGSGDFLLSRLSIRKGRIELDGEPKTVGDVVEFDLVRTAVDDIHYTVRTNLLQGEIDGRAVEATESGKEYRQEGTAWWATVEKYTFLATGVDGTVEGAVSNYEVCDGHTRCSEFGTARLLAGDVWVRLEDLTGVSSLDTKGLEVRINGDRVTTSIEKGEVQVTGAVGNIIVDDKVRDHHNEFPLE